MELKEFYYDLPEELIAQDPIENREESRLLVLNKDHKAINHKSFKDIVEILDDGDCLVLNDTRVIPARLFGIKEKTGGRMEFVLLKNIGQDLWETLVRPGRRAKIGARFVFGDNDLVAEVIEEVEDGNRIIRFEYDGVFETILDRIGIMPLPPYIKKELKDKERYQTVYAKNNGSAAAPTAGLHFTNELLEKLKAKGVKLAYVTLHVGLGTFRPVKVSTIEEHTMHAEFYDISRETCDIINQAKEQGKRLIAVGTTACRVLETVSNSNGIVNPTNGWTDIFIYPGYEFKIIDGLITNFHLPESTLLMLISALAGREVIMKAYSEAIKESYRFFSFGDAMLII
jgi:S-adenosylmethionine:tRNA ribosyltransferase-isomerase